MQVQSNARKNLLKGFLLGVGLIIFSNGVQFLTRQAKMPTHLGGWIDLAVECVLAGLLIGGLGVVIGKRQDAKGKSQQ
jgi:hypothetical protein